MSSGWSHLLDPDGGTRIVGATPDARVPDVVPPLDAPRPG
jgi:hypothetical protein